MHQKKEYAYTEKHVYAQAPLNSEELIPRQIIVGLQDLKKGRFLKIWGKA